jgi:hypothetical protein
MLTSSEASTIWVRRSSPISSATLVSSSATISSRSFAGSQDLFQVLDLDHQVVELVLDLVAFEAREPAQLQFQDGLGLDFGESELSTSPMRASSVVVELRIRRITSSR